jgi:MFS family permease
MAQGLALTAIVSTLPEMARDLGPHGEFVAQMAMAMAALGLMAGALASGWILAKAGTRLTLLSSLVAYGLAGTGGVLLRKAWPLLASRFGLGFAAACVVTSCVWGIGAAYEGRQRAKAFGFAGALSSVAGLVGSLLGGYLAKWGGWPFASLQYPLFAVAGFVLAFVGIRQVRPQREEVGAVRRPQGHRLLAFYGLVVILFTIFSIGGTLFPFLLQETGLRDPAIRSWILSVPTVAAILSSLSYGTLQVRLGIRGTFTLGLTCMTAGLALIGWTSLLVYAGLGASLMGACIGLVGPYLYHAVTERTDAYARTRHIGILNAVTFFGVFLNPLVFAPLSNAIGSRKTFQIAALIMAMVVLLTANLPLRRVAT